MSPVYAQADNWLCRPGRNDVCNGAPVGIVLNRDGSTSVLTPNHDPGRDRTDCFYVYPTANGSLWPGNIGRQEAELRIEAVARAQTALFSRSCRVFAPRYRQISLIGYLLPEAMRRRYLLTAASDVVDAFEHYLAVENGGRDIVLVGHSQGAEILAHLIRNRFDHKPDLRAKLRLAVLAGFPVYVPEGRDRGATFRNVPVYLRPGQTGCVVAYRIHREGSADVKADRRIRLSPGEVEVCVNPATLDLASATAGAVGHAQLAGSIFLRSELEGAQRRRHSQPLVAVEGLYEARCAPGHDKRTRYLGVREASSGENDHRHGLIGLTALPFITDLGLHHLDLQLPAADIRNLIIRRSEAATMADGQAGNRSALLGPDRP